MYRVVIVEDEELEREALCSILTQGIDGLRILGEARTGAEAVRMIDDFPIDLMLVDINIPEINGLEVIRHLRKNHPDTKVIITTAYDYFETARAAIHLKVDEYLLKPIRARVLLTTVHACLQQLGAGRLCRELARQMDILLESHDYLNGVGTLRRHVDWIYEQEDCAPAVLLLDLAETLVVLAGEKGLHMGALRQHAARLRSMRLDSQNRHQVFEIFLQMAQYLFTTADAVQNTDAIHKALYYIESNLSKGVTLEEVAQHAHVSACYLSKLFKKNLNVNFLAYMTRRRMELAQGLLRKTDLPVTDIALELSYNDVNYFSKLFKKETGLSPTQFRTQQENEK